MGNGVLVPDCCGNACCGCAMCVCGGVVVMVCGDVGRSCAFCVRVARGGGVSLLPVAISGCVGMKPSVLRPFKID